MVNKDDGNNDDSDDDVTYLVNGRVLLGLPDELYDDDDERQHQAADEHDEHTAHVTARVTRHRLYLTTVVNTQLLHVEDQTQTLSYNRRSHTAAPRRGPDTDIILQPSFTHSCST